MATDHSSTTTIDDAQTDSDSHVAVNTESTSELEGAFEKTPGTNEPAYNIRPYERQDRDDVLELYDLTGAEHTEDWFHWAYETNPYTDQTPIMVATTGDHVVGAKPCVPLEMRTGQETRLGLQPAETLIHPDHRRKGLERQLTDRTKTHYQEREPALFFDFQRQSPQSGHLNHGWETVEDVPTSYRVHRPTALIDTETGDAVAAQLERIAAITNPLATGYVRARDALVNVPSDVSVERFEDVPIETFVDLYERSIPRTIHANRDETFYGWRFENPMRSSDVYVATRYGQPIAGMITETTTQNGSQHTSVVDVVPLGPADGRTDGLTAILECVLEDRHDADIVTVSGNAIPSQVLGQFGFHTDQTRPLSSVSSQTTLVAEPIANDGGHELTVAGFTLTDPSNWTVTGVEQTTRQ